MLATEHPITSLEANKHSIKAYAVMAMVDGVSLWISASEESLPIALATSSMPSPPPTLSMAPRQPRGQYSWKALENNVVGKNKHQKQSDTDEDQHSHQQILQRWWQR